MDEAMERRLRALIDKDDIAGVVQKWAMTRDQGLWGDLAETFHPGGRIKVMWFSGTHDDFITACARRFKPGIGATKHFFGVSSITLNGDRALAESPAFISQEGEIEGVKFTSMSFLRFLDRFERRAGVWRIAQRNSIYEGDRLAPEGPLALDPKILDGYGRPFRYLAYRQVKAAQQVDPQTPLDASPALELLMREARAWLAA